MPRLSLAALHAAALADGNSGAVKALGRAENNADDTVYIEKAAPVAEWEDIALRSISLTAPFEQPGVAAWFKAQGYEW
jgi:hypothetical protein